MNSKRTLTILFVFLSFLFYFLIAQTPRFETVNLIALFLFLFAIYVTVIQSKAIDEQVWWWSAIGFRLLLLIFTPLLSDDVYRFIWDGRLLAEGIHPFGATPSQLMQSGVTLPGINAELFNHLNSPEYFTVYPPVCQFVFLLTAKLFSGSIGASILFMKLLLIAADVGTLFILRQLLTYYQLPSRQVFIYALNPLVILELSGNLHFEAVMIFCMVLSVWYLVREKFLGASFAFSLAIATKLLPLILLPLFFYRLGWKKALSFSGYTITFCILLFAPLYSDELITGMSKGIGYYFKKFEFNASIYYLVREYGYWKHGYNIIQTIGWKLALWCAMFIGVYALLESQFRMEDKPITQPSIWFSFLVVFTLYCLFTTTLHPWYIATLLAFAVFTQQSYVVLWSATIFLTYAGYTRNGFSENYFVLVLEYGSLLILIGYEIIRYIRSHHLTEHRNFRMK